MLQLSSQAGDGRSRTPQRRQPSAIRTQIPRVECAFDESKFTDAYFRSWEGDIDSNEEFDDDEDYDD